MTPFEFVTLYIAPHTPYISLTDLKRIYPEHEHSQFFEIQLKESFKLKLVCQQGELIELSRQYKRKLRKEKNSKKIKISKIDEFKTASLYNFSRFYDDNPGSYLFNIPRISKIYYCPRINE